MTSFEFDPNFFPREVENLTEDTCFDAYEILAYALKADNSQFHWTDDGNSFKLIGNFISPGDGTTNPIIHSTSPIQSSERKRIRFTNRPYLLDQHLHLQPVTQPGFIAMHQEPLNLSHSAFPPVRSTIEQIIFQIPNPSHAKEAAIYEGFDLEESSRIDDNEEKIMKLKAQIYKCKHQLRQIIAQQIEGYEPTYLSTTPLDPIELELADILNKGYL